MVTYEVVYTLPTILRCSALQLYSGLKEFGAHECLSSSVSTAADMADAAACLVRQLSVPAARSTEGQ